MARGTRTTTTKKTKKEEFYVKVAVRVRPMLAHDNQRDDVIETGSEGTQPRVTILDPAKAYGGKKEAIDYLRVDVVRERTYEYDHVFGGEDCTRRVFDEAVAPLVDVVCKGVNVTIFAYGQTGSGKTHTMLGGHGEASPQATDREEPGVMRLALEQLFKHTDLAATGGGTRRRVVVSFVELYNEEIRDLLADGPARAKVDHGGVGGLEIWEDPQRGPTIAGVREMEARDVDAVMDLLHQGNARRTQESTKANAVSSRSHAVLQIVVETTEKVANKKIKASASEDHAARRRVVNVSRRAKLCMIDLAGSERAAQTHNSGPRLTEGARINRSLLALGNVINGLRKAHTQPDSKVYVNFRDSKLTRLLKDSLGGNTRTLMLAHASPAASSFEETLNTLKYAHRARSIKNSVRENIRRHEKRPKLAAVAPAPPARDPLVPLDHQPGGHHHHSSSSSSSSSWSKRSPEKRRRGEDAEAPPRQRRSMARDNKNRREARENNFDDLKSKMARRRSLSRKPLERKKNGRSSGSTSDALHKTRWEVIGQLREAIELRQTVREMMTRRQGTFGGDDDAEKSKKNGLIAVEGVTSPLSKKTRADLFPALSTPSPRFKADLAAGIDEDLLMRDPLAFLSKVLMNQTQATANGSPSGSSNNDNDDAAAASGGGKSPSASQRKLALLLATQQQQHQLAPAGSGAALHASVSPPGGLGSGLPPEGPHDGAREQRLAQRAQRECEGLRRAVKRNLEKHEAIMSRLGSTTNENAPVNGAAHNPAARHHTKGRLLKLLDASKDEQNALVDAEMRIVGLELEKLELEAQKSSAADHHHHPATTDARPESQGNDRDIHEVALKKLELQVRLRNSVIKKLVHELEKKRSKPPRAAHAHFPAPPPGDRAGFPGDTNNGRSRRFSANTNGANAPDPDEGSLSPASASSHRNNAPASQLFAEILGSHEFLAALPKAADVQSLPSLAERPRSGGNARPGWRR